MSRRGEKLGWLGGWSGGFVWVVILAFLFVFQGRTGEGLIGFVVAAVAFAAIWLFAPWRHPRARFRVLMIPIYVMFFIAVAWGVWGMEDPRQMGVSPWSVFLLFPLLLPMWTAGRRRWVDGEVGAAPTEDT